MRTTPANISRRGTALLVAALFVLIPACQKGPNPMDELSPPKAKPTGKREFGEIKPVMLTLPDKAIQALDAVGPKNVPLKDVPVYFRSLAIVAYRDPFDAPDYMKRIAAALAAFAEVEAFSKEADNWTIQLEAKAGGRFVTLSCSPKASAEYAKSGDVSKFLADCDFMMIDDVIVSNREERRGYYDGRLTAPSNQATQEAPL